MKETLKQAVKQALAMTGILRLIRLGSAIKTVWQLRHGLIAMTQENIKQYKNKEQ